MVSKFLKISKTTVIRVVKKYISEKNHLRKAGSGRKRSFGEVEMKKIDCLLQKNPQLTSSDIKKALNLNATARTIRNTLKNLKYINKKPIKKPLLTFSYKGRG